MKDITVSVKDTEAFVELLENSFEFFSWFNKTYPNPSTNPDHPWCKLGSTFSKLSDGAIDSDVPPGVYYSNGTFFSVRDSGFMGLAFQEQWRHLADKFPRYWEIFDGEGKSKGEVLATSAEEALNKSKIALPGYTAK